MKHRVSGRKFSRIKKQRVALLKTLLGSLIVKEKITTTEAKAKEIKSLVDRLINKAKKSKTDDAKRVGIIRDLRKHLPMVAITKLTTGDFIGRFGERTSGFTRVIKLEQRKSDGARMAVIEFV